MDLAFGRLLEGVKGAAVAQALTLAIVLGVVGVLVRALLREEGGAHKVIGKLFGNWQLALLATTAFVLSLASGWTTWDGMRNFTGEPVLSLMVTFGIQGVMLIIAWLIGESFATGMNHAGHGAGSRGGPVASFIAVVLFPLAVAALAIAGGLYLWRNWGTLTSDQMSAVAATVGAAMIVLALMAAFAKSDVVSPYLQSARVVVKNSVLWVMFLACMATSVFFSFDSLFTAIFPQSERVRAAELRAQNQVAGLIADIGTTIEGKRQAEAQRLFTDKGWLAYDQQLAALARAAQGASAEITRYFDGKIEERNRALNQQRERITTAQSGQAGLASKKTVLVEELTRLKGERGTLAADLAEKKTELDARARGLDAKRVEAMAEEKGAEGSLKVGRGPIYRQRLEELGKLQEAFKIQDDRVRDATKRSTAADARIAQIERELAGIDGDLAKLKGDADTAEQRIKLSLEQLPSDGAARVDPDRLVPAFESARAEFRQEPTVEHLGRIQSLCGQLHAAMSATDVTKPRLKGIDCDPRQAAEAAAVVFALNDGLKTYAAQCAGGDKLARHSTTDGLFGFARKCLADSGLPGKETEQVRSRINFMDLSRDDKAHRFVVTWNAFGDGNRLAYLALAIAIAIDSLVFMSGLFGANALRSPLSDVPSLKARSAKQLEAIVENALLPDRLENARLTLQAMHPITAHEGFTQEVLVPIDAVHWKHAVLGVLNAGAAIGAVRRDPNRAERYLVRPELFEFLSVVARREFDRSDKALELTGNRKLAELRRVVTVALQPHVGDHAEVVLGHVHPISEKGGYTSEILLNEVPDHDRSLVRKLLNAGSALAYVQRDDRKGEEDRYYLHRDLFITLAKISAEHPPTGRRSGLPQVAGPGHESQYRGELQSERAGIAADDRSQQKVAALPSRAPPTKIALVEDMSAAGAQPAAGGVPERVAASRAQVARVQPIGPRSSQPEDWEANALETFRGKLLDAIRVRADAYAAISANEATRDAAKRAGEILRSLSTRDNFHGEEVARLHESMKDALKIAYDGMWTRLGDNDPRWRALKDASDELDGLLYALMLSPAGPYETRLSKAVTDLKLSATPYTDNAARNKELLDHLSNCRDQLAAVKGRSAEDWEAIARIVTAWHGSGTIGRQAASA